MNCRDIEPLLHAEQDGRLTTQQQAALTQHVAACPACRQQRRQLNAALAAYRTDVAAVSVPDVGEAWHDLQNRLAQPATKPAKKRPLAPVIWFGTSLAAAAAALALVFLTPDPKPQTQDPTPRGAAFAQANYVEVGDQNATTLVFTDQQSGWLVVWAAEPVSSSNG